MTEEELRQRNFELAEQNRKLSETVKNLLEPRAPEVPHIKADDLAPGGKHAGQIDLRAIEEGRIIVDMPEPEKVEPKAGEIHMADPNLPNRLSEVASGKLRVIG